MAVISTIRNQSTLLIGVIGVAMLFFIVGGDFLASLGGPSQEQNVAEINGESYSIQYFEQRIEQQIKLSYGQRAPNEQQRTALREQIWNKMTRDEVMNKEYAELGVNVGAKEIFAAMNNGTPSPRLTQFFTNPNTGRVDQQFMNPATGGLDANKVMDYANQMLDGDNPAAKASWIALEEGVREDLYTSKYNTLIGKGLNVTAAEAKAEIKAKGRSVNVKYAAKLFSDLPDEDVTVSDSDLNTYYNNHQNEDYIKQDVETRGVEYVKFSVVATPEDDQNIKDVVSDLVASLKNAEDDTLFVTENSDTPGQISYFRGSELPENIGELAISAEIGEVFGPYTENGYYKIAKVLGHKTASDSVNARHILLKIVKGDTVATQNLADSLKRAIKRNNNFAELAPEFSEDLGSADKGGDLDWFTEGRMVPEFNDACFAGKIGDLITVTTQFGIHLIEITDKTEEVKKALIGVVDRRIAPSNTTFDANYEIAADFAKKNRTTNDFRTAANDIGMRVADQVKEGDAQITGITDSKEIVRWAYSSSAGTVSEPFEIEEAFYVCHVKDVREKGKLGLEVSVVKDRVREAVLNAKKAEKIKSDLGNVASVEEAATKFGQSVESIVDLKFSAQSVANLGGEKVFIGAAHGLQQGATSKALVDNKGVYVISADLVTEAAEGNVDIQKGQMTRSLSGRAGYAVLSALKVNANIVDNRGKFY